MFAEYLDWCELIHNFQSALEFWRQKGKFFTHKNTYSIGMLTTQKWHPESGNFQVGSFQLAKRAKLDLFTRAKVKLTFLHSWFPSETIAGNISSLALPHLLSLSSHNRKPYTTATQILPSSLCSSVHQVLSQAPCMFFLIPSMLNLIISTL